MKLRAFAYASLFALVSVPALAIDYGDAPDIYGTTIGAGGPSHVVIPTLRIGATVDSEADGQPTPAANGDGADEDGVRFAQNPLVAGTLAILDVTVLNNTGVDATLVGWIDMNGNGVFEPGEGQLVNVPSDPNPQSVFLTFNLPSTADIDTGGAAYARFRLSTSATLTTATPGGAAPDGEVEDYLVLVSPPGESIAVTNNRASVPRGTAVSYLVAVQYSGLTGVTRVVDVPMDPAFDPASITWICVANGAASCVSGSPLGTSASGTGPIVAQAIDLEQGGQVFYQVTANVRTTTPPATVSVTGTLNTGQTSTDTDPVVVAAFPGAALAVPVNGPWALLLLAAAMLAAGAVGSRRRS